MSSHGWSRMPPELAHLVSSFLGIGGAMRRLRHLNVHWYRVSKQNNFFYGTVDYATLTGIMPLMPGPDQINVTGFRVSSPTVNEASLVPLWNRMRTFDKVRILHINLSSLFECGGTTRFNAVLPHLTCLEDLSTRGVTNSSTFLDLKSNKKLKKWVARDSVYLVGQFSSLPSSIESLDVSFAQSSWSGTLLAAGATHLVEIHLPFISRSHLQDMSAVGMPRLRRVFAVAYVYIHTAVKAGYTALSGLSGLEEVVYQPLPTVQYYERYPNVGVMACLPGLRRLRLNIDADMYNVDEEEDGLQDVSRFRHGSNLVRLLNNGLEELETRDGEDVMLSLNRLKDEVKVNRLRRLHLYRVCQTYGSVRDGFLANMTSLTDLTILYDTCTDISYRRVRTYERELHLHTLPTLCLPLLTTLRLDLQPVKLHPERGWLRGDGLFGILAHSFPNLTDLYLRSTVSWEADALTRLRGLEQLELTLSKPLSPGDIASLDALTDGVRGPPNLRELKLSNILDGETPAPPTPGTGGAILHPIHYLHKGEWRTREYIRKALIVPYNALDAYTDPAERKVAQFSMALRMADVLHGNHTPVEPLVEEDAVDEERGAGFSDDDEEEDEAEPGDAVIDEDKLRLMVTGEEDAHKEE